MSHTITLHLPAETVTFIEEEVEAINRMLPEGWVPATPSTYVALVLAFARTCRCRRPHGEPREWR